MALTRIPYRNTGYFSSLICDLVDGHPALAKFQTQPVDIGAFEKQIATKANQFSSEKRAALVLVLKEQYQQLPNTAAVLENVDLLAQANTFTVTTGHQLNLFTGPLYFVYKIISTIKLCQQLKEKYSEQHFVPVYWMATEDHDFEEISFFHFKGKKIKWTQESSGAVGRMSLEELTPLLTLFEQNLGENKAATQIKAFIEHSYRSSQNLAEATLRLVHQLFSDYGLVILDADQRALKANFVPHIKSELTEGNCFSAVNQSIEALKKDYNSAYNPQVNPREINLFYLTDQGRERIVKTPSAFALADSNTSFTKEDLLKEVEAFPERFSPNVLMRPLYQEVILPNLCYIGGGGEIAYWLQLKNYFERENISFPLLLLRNSALLISAKNTKKLNRLGLDFESVFLKRTPLINKKIRAISNIDLDLQPLKDKLTEQFDHLESLVEATDPSFEGTVKAQKQKQFKGIDQLEKRLLNAQKKKLVDHVERLSTLHEALFPQESLQERHDNFFEFYLEYGADLLPQLFDQLDPLQLEFSCIELP